MLVRNKQRTLFIAQLFVFFAIGSVNINSIVKPRIGGTHNTIQYRISIYGKENIKEFGKIGFSIQMHKERLERALAKYS